MKKLFKTLLASSSLLFFVEFSSYCAITNTPPVAADLVSKGNATLRKLAMNPASWTVTCRLGDQDVVRILVVRAGKRQSWNLWQVEDGRPEKMCQIIQLGETWYVQEKGYFAKTRPYEAELHFPSAYTFLAMAELRNLLDQDQLSAATFKGRVGSKLSYGLPLPTENRRLLEKVVSEYQKLGAKDPSYLKKPEVIQTLKQVQEQLTNGIPFSIDEETGIIVESRIKQLTVAVNNFRWLGKVPEGAFELPRGVEWADHAAPWPDSDYENCILVGHDPAFSAADSSKPTPDGYMLNLRTEELRRIAYQGAVTMPGCFLKDRHKVLVSGFDLLSGPETLKINLVTGASAKMGDDSSGVNLNLFGELSPDGKKVAVIRSFSGASIVDFQIRLIDMDSGQSQEIGKPGPIGAPFSWLPDGSGLILKRYEQTGDLDSVERRILCRLDLDGRLTDLRPGDSPVVLRKTRKILYEDNDTGMWHTCDLDGSAPELYADGLKGYGMPALSPDESRVIFAYYEKGRLPQLILFEIGKSKGKPVGHSEGFTSMPIWR